MKGFEMIGQRFGRLVVTEEAPRRNGRGDYWHVRCDCGSERIVYGSSLRRGATQSCRCLFRERHEKRRRPLAERFWAKVRKSNGCWLWTGSTNEDGYGQFHAKNIIGEHAAHRVSWWLHHGPVPTGSQVLHNCDNPSCVRPDHLFLGTQAENIADMTRKGRNRGPSGDEHPKARVTERDIPGIRAATGSLREIGYRYGLTISAVHAIRKRRTWRHVP